MSGHRVGPYVLERELGAGAMGAVWLGRHVELGATYAIKILHPDLCEESDAVRFQRELESMAAVSNHPNVVRIHTGGAVNGRLYCVMDLVEGDNLQDWVAKGPMDPKEAARIVLGISRAVAALHAQGMIHRDIKPENVLMDPDGKPRLTDFGLARLVSDERGRLTHTGELIGTPVYMAPEQALGLTSLGPAADVYALGSVLYVLLAGRPPVNGTSKMMVLSKVASGELEPLAVMAPDAPQPLAEICGATLTLAPEDRPSAQDMVEALERYLAEEGPSRAAGEVRQRRRIIRALLSLMLAAVVLGVATVGLAIYRDGQQKLADLRSRAATAISDGHTCLTSGETAGSERVAAADVLHADLVAAGLSEEAAEILGLSAELAFSDGDMQGARARLDRLRSLPEPEEKGRRDRRRAVITAIEARSALAAGDREEAAKLRRRLDRALKVLPARVDLRVLLVRLCLAAGRAEDAAQALGVVGDAAPGALRFEVAMANKDWQRALSLEEQAQDPAERSRLHLELAMEVRDVDALIAHMEKTGDLPRDHPLREKAIKDLHRRSSTLLRTARGAKLADGRSEAAGRAMSFLEVAKTYLALTLLAPEYEIPKAELDDLEGHGLASGGTNMSPEDLEVFLRLDPRRLTYISIYCTLVLDRGIQNYPLEKTLPRFKLAFDLALAKGNAEAAQPLDMYAKALREAQQLEPLRELLESSEKHFTSRDDVGHVVRVRTRYGQLLRIKGEPEKALEQFERCLRDHPGDKTARGSRFETYCDLYNRDRDEGSLERAITDGEELVRVVPADTPQERQHLMNLAHRLVLVLETARRFEHALDVIAGFRERVPEGYAFLSLRRLELMIEQPGGPQVDEIVRQVEFIKRNFELDLDHTRKLTGPHWDAHELRLEGGIEAIPQLTSLAKSQAWDALLETSKKLHDNAR